MELQYILIRTHRILELINREGVIPSTVERNADVFANIYIELQLLKDHAVFKTNLVLRNLYLNFMD
jgi:hypothetical protein